MVGRGRGVTAVPPCRGGIVACFPLVRHLVVPVFRQSGDGRLQRRSPCVGTAHGYRRCGCHSLRERAVYRGHRGVVFVIRVACGDGAAVVVISSPCGDVRVTRVIEHLQARRKCDICSHFPLVCNCVGAVRRKPGYATSEGIAVPLVRTGDCRGYRLGCLSELTVCRAVPRGDIVLVVGDGHGAPDVLIDKRIRRDERNRFRVRLRAICPCGAVRRRLPLVRHLVVPVFRQSGDGRLQRRFDLLRPADRDGGRRGGSLDYGSDDVARRRFDVVGGVAAHGDDAAIADSNHAVGDIAVVI